MIKCIVWDLDGTLWHGTLANGDPLVINEPALHVARMAESKGVFQSIASRNDSTAALKQLESFGLGSFFLYPRIEPWLIKSQAVADIAAHFNISLDSVAFVDDEPFERYEVGRYLPEVAVYAADALHGLEQDINRLAASSGDRRAWMENREARLAAEKAFTGTRAEFLQECQMRLTVRLAVAADRARVEELTNRARKINTAVVPSDTLLTPEDDPNRWLYVCELDDRFGTHGVVGVGMFRREGTLLAIERFVCSCRVEGRGIASAFLQAVLTRLTARKTGLTAVTCHITDTQAGMALALFKSMGFSVIKRSEGTADMRLALPNRGNGVSWIETRYV